MCQTEWKALNMLTQKENMSREYYTKPVPPPDHRNTLCLKVMQCFISIRKVDIKLYHTKTILEHREVHSFS